MSNIPKPKTYEQIFESIQDSLRADVSPNIVLDNTTLLGNLANTVAAWTKRYVDNEVQNAVQASYWATATSGSVDNLFELFGLQRIEERPSQVVGILEVAGNGTVPEGSIATFTTGSFESPFTWRLDADVVNGDATPAFLSGTFSATVAGPTPFLAPNTLNTIVTPESAWLSVNNPDASVPGRFEERDEAYKLRQRRSLRIPGAGTLPALTANLAAVDGVLNFVIFENTSNVTDSRGVPPNSFSVVVQFDANPDLPNFIQTLLLKSPLGCQAVGSTPIQYTDPSTNIVLEGAYTPAQQLDLYLWIDLFVLPQTSVGQTAYKDALASFFVADELNKLGEDLAITRLYTGPVYSPSNIRKVEILANTVNNKNTAVSSGKIDVLIDQFLDLDPANITITIKEFTNA